MNRYGLAVVMGVIVVLTSRHSSAIMCKPGEVEVGGVCVVRPGPVSPASPVPQEDSGGGHAASAPNHAARAPKELVPARAYLKNTDIPPKGVGAYGIFALHAKVTSATRSRLMMACLAFITALEPQAKLPPSVTIGHQMLTIWPLDNPDAQAAKDDDCEFLLDHYDIYSADSAIADAKKQHGDFHGGGPFLIGWSPSDTRGKPDELVLVIDMSSYDSQDSFNHAFQMWKDEIVENPDLWRHGWSLEELRLVIHDFADEYGSDILFAAHLSDGSGKKD
jgi:hypothetical protein